MLRQAAKLIGASQELHAAFEHLLSIPGIGTKSAPLLLGELALLPRDLSVREWVAHAGLDPKRHVSGTSVEQRERISKVGNARIRRALRSTYGACRRWWLCSMRTCRPSTRSSWREGSRRLSVAVMRKLLQAIYGMLKHDQDFDGAKFYAIPEKVPVAA